MPSPLEPRPRFYQGQYIGPEDLNAAVTYARAEESRHILGAHVWGIAMGLSLVETAVPGGGVQVSLTPGYGWDGFGRPITVLAQMRLSEALFAAYKYDPAIDAGGAGRLLPVWLRYDEQNVQPPPAGFQVCNVDDQTARVFETFAFEVGDQKPPAHDNVFVAGRSVEPAKALLASDPTAKLVCDESIPFQGFPADGDPSRWLLPLGYVRWLPTATGGGGFVALNKPDDTNAARRLRRYVGLVAESVLAADCVLRLARRGDAPSTYFSPPVEETVWISGKTRAEDDVRLAGAMLEWRDASGDNHGVVLGARRRQGDDGKAGLGGRSLEVLLGPDGTSDNLLTVGPVDGGNKVKAKFVVMSGGNVGLGTDAPTAMLELLDGNLLFQASGEDAGDIIFQGSGGDQKGRVWSNPTVGAGLFLASAGTTPHVAIAADGKVGIGTQTPTNRLHVADAIGVRQNRLYLSGGDGWSSLTYNAYHDTANANWVMPDPSRPAMTIELDDLNGTPRCEIYSNTAGTPGGWISRFKVDGGTGNVGVGTGAPQTILHAVGDRIRLENGGKRISLRADGSAVDLQSDTHDLYLRSSGPGGTNVIMNPFAGDGMVAIGHQAPICKLHVAGDAAGTEGDATSHVALMENTGGGGGDVLALRLPFNLIPGTNNFLTFLNGGRPVGNVQRNADGFSISYNSSGADFAEALPLKDAGEHLEAGDVVGIVGGLVTRKTADAHHFAVVSTNPVVVGNAPQPDRKHLHAQIAFLGQVPVKVRGPVRAGMFLVPSGDDDGAAVGVSEDELGADAAAKVVARAWQSDERRGTRPVRAVVGLGAREAALAVRLRRLEALVAGAAPPRPGKKVGGPSK